MTEVSPVADEGEFFPAHMVAARPEEGDPFPVWAAQRAEGPVVELASREVRARFHSPDSLGDRRVFMTLDYETGAEALREGSVFSSTVYADTIGRVFGNNILQMDGREHRSYRTLIQMAFAKAPLRRWAEEVLPPILKRCVDRLAGDRSADLVRAFAWPFPARAIGSILGLPEEDLPRFQRWAIDILSATREAPRASAALRDFLTPMIALRRAEPADDIIGLLAVAELDGRRLSDEEIVSFIRLLLPAGLETTFHFSGTLLYALLADREQLQAVADDRTLVPRAIEEGLRWQGPVPSIARITTTDTRLGEVDIPAGTAVAVNLVAGNRDPSRWPEPDRFDYRREPKTHLGFGTGAHTCLGAHLARVELEQGLNALLDRLPNLRLDPHRQAEPRMVGYNFRGPDHLPVVWD